MTVMTLGRNNLTAGEMIKVLQELPEDTVLSWREHDSEYAITYCRGVAGVNAEGVLQHGESLGALSEEECDAEYDASERKRLGTPRERVLSLIGDASAGVASEEDLIRALSSYPYVEVTPDISDEDYELSFLAVEAMVQQGVITEKVYNAVVVNRRDVGYYDYDYS